MMRETKRKEKKSDNLDENEKEPLINMKGKRKSTIIRTMDEKDQLKKCEKKGKKVICDNLNDKKRTFEKRGQRKKKRKI